MDNQKFRHVVADASEAVVESLMGNNPTWEERPDGSEGFTEDAQDLYCEVSDIIESSLLGHFSNTSLTQAEIKTKAIIRASKFYLFEPLAEDFFELDEEEVIDFIRDHRWQPFEYWEPHGVWELIESLADEFMEIDQKSI